jgi:hypothetical protein
MARGEGFTGWLLNLFYLVFTQIISDIWSCSFRRNMSLYQVEFHLPEILGQEFMSKIPRHRELIHEMMSERIVLAYAVNTDRSKGWITIVAENESEVEEILMRSPIYRYLNYDIFELFIYDAEHLRFPRLALN